MTQKFHLGLIGWPLEHSLSPVIHEAALKTLKLDGDYRCFPIEPLPKGEVALDNLLNQLRSGDLHGLNVTLPHKTTVIEKIDRLTPAAKRIGAVNTLFVRESELLGDNTDQDGFMYDLERTLAPRKRTALVLGAGGAARAVVTGLSEAGWKIWVAARRLSQSEMLATDIGRSSIFPISLKAETLKAITGEIGLIVNATSVGMSPDLNSSPWPENTPLPKGACLYDLVYTPQCTQLMRQAQEDGLQTATGLGMLVEQAALAIERWTAESAPRKAMYAAAVKFVV